MKNNNVRSIIKQVASTIALPVLVYVLMCILRPDIYLSVSTVVSLFKQSLIYVLIGWSMLFGMSCGLFDFSVGSRYILATLFGIWLSQKCGLFGFIVGTIGANLILAGLTGIIFAGLKIPSIITGFAALLIFESLAAIYQTKFSVMMTDEISIFGRTPGIYVVTIVTFVLVYVLFNRTKFGYQIKAIGGNEAIARSMGINSVRLKVMTYLVGGLILGIASMAKAGYDQALRASTSMASMNAAFTPMMAVMIGLYLSSCNPVVGTIIGAFSISVVSAGLVTLGIDYRLQNVVIGVFLICFIGYKTNYQRVLALFNHRHKKQAE
jgi:ribose transport system permease protein